MAAHTMPYMTSTTDKHHHPYYNIAFAQLHCRYRSKVCNNPRAHKRDGSLHRYCEEHRQRANANQKKWAKRRMHAADEITFQHHKLSFEQMLNPALMLACPVLLNVDMPLEMRPTQASPVSFEEATHLWASEATHVALPMLGDDLASESLWATLGLDELKDDTRIEL